MVYKVVQMWESLSTIEGKYNLVYYPGTIVEAVPGSLGIFCFCDYICAQLFAYKVLHFINFVDILEVRGIGKETIPEKIANNSDKNVLNQFYNGGRNSNNLIKPPQGTVCYPSVEVIKKVWLIV